ncbi:DUF6544 family protein [Desulfotomaculum sp. 1211_IL3151]|uniref:DUF6544 family protein n=1 Tax=Desulfotomaculum sp. 1211_IL3151 TaxID=3084055 RepID=UPI002FDB6028
MDNKYIFIIILFSIMLMAPFLIYMSQELKRTYKKEVQKGIARNAKAENNILTEKDIHHLPKPVQKYLNYVGVIGKEKVQNVKVTVDGEMKMDPKKGWVKIKAEQYNFFDSLPTRLFYMGVKMSGIPVLGLHSYTAEEATMKIKVAGLITVVNTTGPEMRISDTTTLFNDMCFFAPATLIDHRIKWESIDDLTVKATFNAYDCQVSALLYFNDKGELIRFVSEDRYYLSMDGSCKRVRWSTPIGNYQERNGLRLATYGEAIWSLPEGEYCYAKFTDIKEVKYNSDAIS